MVYYQILVTNQGGTTVLLIPRYLGTNNEISPTNIVTTENAKKPRYVPKYLSSQDLWDVVGDFNFNSAEGPNLLFYLKVKYQRKDIF